MPEEFFVMTVQSVEGSANRAPTSTSTVEGLIETDGMSASEVFQAVGNKAVQRWHQVYPQRELRNMSVLFYHHELNENPHA